MPSVIDIVLNPEIQAFMKEHEGSDLRALALKKPPHPDWPMVGILDQMKARQKAKTKLPTWARQQHVIFPSADLIEQASSEATASYKASLFTGKTLIDLTGGVGIDFAALSQNFERGIVVEQNPKAAEILQHNLRTLSNGPFDILCNTAEDFVQNMPPCDLLYLDPERRTKTRKGLIRLGDYSPNIFELLPCVQNKAQHILIKTSPMLDIDQACAELGHIAHIHVLEYRKQCKEVLYHLEPDKDIDEPKITVSSLNNPAHKMTFTRAEEENAACVLGPPEKYIFEPGPAFLKAGCFKLLATRYGLKKLHPHTHLYTGPEPGPNFPGKCFELIDVLPVERKTLPIKRANLAVRNFPGTPESLRKKLGLKEGGPVHLFACTLEEDKKALLRTKPIA